MNNQLLKKVLKVQSYRHKTNESLWHLLQTFNKNHTRCSRLPRCNPSLPPFLCRSNWWDRAPAPPSLPDSTRKLDSRIPQKLRSIDLSRLSRPSSNREASSIRIRNRWPCSDMQAASAAEAPMATRSKGWRRQAPPRWSAPSQSWLAVSDPKSNKASWNPSNPDKLTSQAS